MSELPSLKEELTRKSLDQLQVLVGNRESGKITEAQFSTGVDTLWNCVSGLVGEDFRAMIEMVNVDFNDISFVCQHAMRKGGAWIHVSLNRGDYIIVTRGDSPPQVIDHKDTVSAIVTYKKIIKSATSVGYTAI